MFPVSRFGEMRDKLGDHRRRPSKRLTLGLGESTKLGLKGMYLRSELCEGFADILFRDRCL